MATSLVFPQEVDPLTYCRWMRNVTDENEYIDDRQFQIHLRRKMRLVEQRLLATIFQSKFSLKHEKATKQRSHQVYTNSALSSYNSDDDESDSLAFVPRGILRHRSRKLQLATSITTTTFPSHYCTYTKQQHHQHHHQRSVKKHVRFADTVGQQLESVQHIVRSELPPEVPGTALDHLRKQRLRVHRQLQPTFQGPSRDQVRERLSRSGVALERAQAVDTSVQGTVRVKNLAYEKLVTVRYTLDEWRSFVDVEGNYVEGSHDGDSDCFSFSIFVSTAEEEVFVPGNKLHFAVRYTYGRDNDGTGWDNNDGSNYTFECHATSVPVTLNQSWVHFS